MTAHIDWDAIEERELLLEVVRLADMLNPQDFAASSAEAFGALLAVVHLAGATLEKCGEATVFVFRPIEEPA